MFDDLEVLFIPASTNAAKQSEAVKEDGTATPGAETPVTDAKQGSDVEQKSLSPGIFPELDSLPVGCILHQLRRCDCLEIIPGAGFGCVRRLSSGPWREEWRRLDCLQECPKVTTVKKWQQPEVGMAGGKRCNNNGRGPPEKDIPNGAVSKKVP